MAATWPSLLLISLVTLGTNVFVPTSEASKILVVLPFSATSHSNVITALSRELALRGHTVKAITPYPISNRPANYTEINVAEVLLPYFKTPKVDDEGGVLEVFKLLLRVSKGICNGVLEMPEVQDLIKSAQSGDGYDLIINSMFYCDCFYAFAHVFNAPLVLISPAGSFPVTDQIVGNPAPPSFVPNIFSSFSDHMTFLERAQNAMMDFITIAFHRFVIYPTLNAEMKKGFGESVPTIQEIEKERVSLVLLNSHHSILYPRPLNPNVVEVGGMHVKPPKPLPQDIKKFMDEAKEGVIYFSLGSNLKSAEMPEATRDALLAAFAELKQKVLWKWEADNLPGQPANVKISKLFITHGGLLSFQEAVDRGVPLIGIPFYGDQVLNLNRVVSLGVGLKMDYKSITKEYVLKHIRTILDDNSFKHKMKQLSAVWKDQKESPLERAVYWTEYVIRHDGAKHLRSAAVDLAWYQYYLLDVIAAAALVIFLVFSIIIGAFCLLCKMCCKKTKATKKKEGKSSKQKRH
ncbi:UDP-glycosyltransferase [Ladona fulva]|uniref:UDP-glycosyltransferase n=1 Tax=Ladona fulva TaxID=123851 RepID=A0A8K0K4Z3_LADFU|nr:UDP-glycosyltransferase [Ladona fulva]